jgi:uncharacterized protein YbjT (DUF2867 family)
VQQVDVEGTRALLQAAYASGSHHIVYISIVGVDRTAYFYYQGKYETELLIEQGPLPWTIVRTTQFHPFVLQIIRSLGADTPPEVPVPAGARFQSIDVGEVASPRARRGLAGASATMLFEVVTCAIECVPFRRNMSQKRP